MLALKKTKVFKAPNYVLSWQKNKNEPNLERAGDYSGYCY